MIILLLLSRDIVVNPGPLDVCPIIMSMSSHIVAA